MKKYTPVFTLLLLISLVIPARADLLWSPDNSFYEQHAEECDYVGRQQYANGGEGFITLWTSPNRTAVSGQCENGTKLWLYYVYGDWGYVSGNTAHRLEGWVPLTDLEQVYDGTSFEEEYGSSFTGYNGEFTGFPDGLTTLVCFEYPGAETSKAEFDLSKTGNLSEEIQKGYISRIFVDEDGLTWGYIGYLFGVRDIWFCLDRPGGHTFPPRAVPQPDLIPTAEPRLPTVSVLPWVLVGGAVILTAGILIFLARRRKKAA